MKRVFGLAILFLCLSAVVWAQTPTGGIDGTVRDPSGAVIPGATVTITEQATSRAITAKTNEVGRYSVRNLLPGAYNLEIAASGFSTYKLENIQISSGAVVNGDAAMEVGRTEEVVQVMAAAVAVDTTRQTVDSVITEKQIQEVPLFGRNFLELAALAPGTYIRDGGAIDPTKSVAYRTVGVVGRSGTATRIQVDGVDVTDETVGTTAANFSDESVQEFQLTRSSLDPSTSLTSSGAVNIISKSGSNAIHGTGFFDYFNENMQTRPRYDPADPAGPPQDRRKRTGFGAGGPFVKDKLFWFVDWERSWETGLSTSVVPEFPQLNVNQSFPTDIRFAEGRMDWNATSAIRVFYKFHHDYNLATGGGAVSPYQTVNWTNTSTVGFDFTQAKMTHTYRFGYVNFNNRIESQELDFKFNRAPNGIPYYLSVGPYGAGPNSLAPQATYQNNYQNSYEGSWVVQRHTLRYGFDVRRIILGGFANFAGPLTINGTYDDATIKAIQARGGNIQDPLEYPFSEVSVGPDLGFFNLPAAHNLPHGGHYDTRIAWFAQDSWKLHRQFTMNIGIRWQYDTQYFSSYDVPRDPILERYGKNYSTQPRMPKDLFSPSFGFAWDITGSGKTVLRGGMYRGYEMNIMNNTMFDEFSMLPNGLGPDQYFTSEITGPDGTPINVDGKHPAGDYTDLLGLPIKNVVGTMGDIKAAVSAAYANYKFDPQKGVTALVSSNGLTYGGTIPGETYRIPYALQFNIGVQRELKSGTVLSADFIYNHAVGLPFFLVDKEYRLDASTLNVSAARTKINSVLGGQTVDQWIASHPTGTIRSFGLTTDDTIYTGLYPDLSRLRLWDGGFTKYKGLQISLRGNERSLWRLKDVGYTVSYALARGESAGAVGRVEFGATPLDNHVPNAQYTFGPNNLDFTHMFNLNNTITIPGGFRFNSFWNFRTAGAQNITVPNFGGAISSQGGFFGTDLNGDGGRGTTPQGDVLPGVNAGQFGRAVKNFEDLNAIITAFNSNYAGKLTPHGQALVKAGLFTEAQLVKLGAVTQTIPLVPTSNPNPWHNRFTTDLRVDRPINLGKVREGLSVNPFLDFFNLFNHNPRALYGGLGATTGSLNYDYSKAGNMTESGLDSRQGRLDTFGRRLQFGFRVNF
jgi:hypothetical protein